MYNRVRNWNMSRGSRLRNYVASSRLVSSQTHVIRVTYTRHGMAQNKVAVTADLGGALYPILRLSQDGGAFAIPPLVFLVLSVLQKCTEKEVIITNDLA